MSDVRVQGDGSSVVNGITVNTPYENDKKNQSLDMQDFLQLMIAEMTNQDFMGSDGGGGSQSSSAANYVTQMAQMATMQQMEQLAYYSKTNYAMSLVGKQATVASLGIGGSVKKDVGIVDRVTLSDDEYLVYVNGKGYKLSEVMNVGVPGSEDSDELKKVGTSNLIVTDKTDDSLRVRWNAPKVTRDEEKKLVYSVYYSKSNKMDTVEEIEENGTLVDTTEKAKDDDRHYMDITGLEPGETYYIAVVVKSPSGLKYNYLPQKVEME